MWMLVNFVWYHFLTTFNDIFQKKKIFYSDFQVESIFFLIQMKRMNPEILTTSWKIITFRQAWKYLFLFIYNIYRGKYKNTN